MFNEQRVRTYLELSSTHLKQETRDYLDEIALGNATGNLGSLSCAATGYGWFVHVDEDAVEQGEDSVYPADLVACMKKAHELGCDYLLLDADGGGIDGLPIYGDQIEEENQAEVERELEEQRAIVADRREDPPTTSRLQYIRDLEAKLAAKPN